MIYIYTQLYTYVYVYVYVYVCVCVCVYVYVHVYASGLFSALIVVLFFSNAHVAYICVTADVLHVTRNTLYILSPTFFTPRC